MQRRRDESVAGVFQNQQNDSVMGQSKWVGVIGNEDTEMVAIGEEEQIMRVFAKLLPGLQLSL